MAIGHLREGAWINGQTEQWSLIDERADWAKQPGNLASLGLPDAVQEASLSGAELMAWVLATVREHFRQEHGHCPLYGEIVGYRLVEAPGVSVRLDIEGRSVETRPEDFAPAASSIQFRNKNFGVGRDGTWKADAVSKEPK